MVLILYPRNELWSNIKSGLIIFDFAKSLWIFPWHVANGIIHHWYFFDSIINWHIYFHYLITNAKNFTYPLHLFFWFMCSITHFCLCVGVLCWCFNLTNHRWSWIKLLNETIQKSFFNYLSISKYKNINNEIIVCKC